MQGVSEVRPPALPREKLGGNPSNRPLRLMYLYGVTYEVIYGITNTHREKSEDWGCWNIMKSFPHKNSISPKKSLFLKPPLFPHSPFTRNSHFLLSFNFIQLLRWFHQQNHTPALPNLAVRDPFLPARTRHSGSRGKGRTSLRSRRIRQLVHSPDVCRRLFFGKKNCPCR